MKKIIAGLLPISTALILLSAMIAPLVAQGADSASYGKARTCYKGVKSDSSAERSDWVRCIAFFEKVGDENPKGEAGARAFYSAGRLRRESYEKFGERADLLAAIKNYNRVIKEYPKSGLTDDALYQIGLLRLKQMNEKEKARRAFAHIVKNYPGGDMAPKAQKMLDGMGTVTSEGSSSSAISAPVLSSSPNTGSLSTAMSGASTNSFAKEPAGGFDHAILTDIDVESTDSSTIVRLKLDRNVAYSMRHTEVGRRTSSPPKLELFLSYVDLIDTYKRKFDISSPHLKKFKLGKRVLGSGAKFSFVMEPGTPHEVKTVGNDIFVRFGGKGLSTLPQVPALVPSQTESDAANTRTKKTFRVVIDPGHGGKDSGAIGPKGTKEKDITLKISKRLARELKKRKGVKVYITRSRDKSLTLEERSAFAIKKRADLFISIHVNASRRKESRGISTYYLNNATDRAAARLAKQENRAARKKLSDVEHILSTMLQNHDTAESSQLARDIQKSMMKRMSTRYPNVTDRGVRSALFYVLVGAKCPAVLLETSFISNPLEERRLRLGHYRDHLAIGAAQGVSEYIKLINKRMVSL